MPHSDSSEEFWQEATRRVGGEALVHTVKEMRNDIGEVKSEITTIHSDVGDMKDTLTKLATAFPGNDTEGHRRYHEAIIERTAEMKRLRIAIQEKTISGLVWLFIVWAGTKLWAYVAGSKALAHLASRITWQ